MSQVRILTAPRVSRSDALSAISLGVTALLAIAVVSRAFSHAIEVWRTTDEFSYGFLVPPIVVGLIWLRRAELRCSIGSGATSGLVIVLASLIVYVGGYRVGINALSGLAVSPLLFGMVVFLWGWRAGRVLAFPIGFLIFGLALYRGLLSSVGFQMQEFTVHATEAVVGVLGLDIVREGLLLRADDSSWGFMVTEACSGMSSLLSLLALASVWTHIVRGSLVSRVLIVLSVVPLVALANTLRVTLVLFVASKYGQDAAEGFFHGASSLVLFGASMAGLMLVSWLLGCRVYRPAV